MSGRTYIAIDRDGQWTSEEHQENALYFARTDRDGKDARDDAGQIYLVEPANISDLPRIHPPESDDEALQRHERLWQYHFAECVRLAGKEPRWPEPGEEVREAMEKIGLFLHGATTSVPWRSYTTVRAFIDRATRRGA